MKQFIGLALIAAAACVGPVHAKSVPPQNACEGISGADGFRMKLITAVANRDAALLKSITHPQVHLDFGGGTGWATMEERLDDPDYRLWEELDKVLRLGCGARGEDELYLPYYWGEDLGTDDAFSTFIVTGDDVPLLREPTEDAGSRQVVKLLDWDVVTLVSEWDDEAEFAEVETSGGERGYVAWSRLRSQVDYRMIVTRDAGDWLITVFIAGD